MGRNATESDGTLQRREGVEVEQAIPDPESVSWMTVPEAGARAFGLNRAASYKAAERGDLPTIRIGQRKLVVPTAALRRLLQLDADPRGDAA